MDFVSNWLLELLEQGFFSVMEIDLFSNTHLHKNASTVQGLIQIDCKIKTASSVDTNRFKL